MIQYELIMQQLIAQIVTIQPLPFPLILIDVALIASSEIV